MKKLVTLLLSIVSIGAFSNGNHPHKTKGFSMPGTTNTLSQVLAAGNNGGGFQIKNIANPTLAQDAATKFYVDNLLTGYVTSVSGTANRITITGTSSAPIVDIAATYVGQSSITTLGTITTGVWNGSTVGVGFGGTGLTSGTSGGILGFTASGTLASSGLLTANALVIGGGAGATPSVLSLGTADQILGMNAGATAHEYKTIVAGSGVSVLNGVGTITFTATGSGGTVTSVSGTANRITSTGGTTPVIDIAATYVGQTSITTLGTVTTGTWNASVISLAYGGTNANLTAVNGGIFYSTASAGAISAAGTSGQILKSNGAAAPTWIDNQKSKAISISNPTTSDSIVMFYTKKALTVTSMYAVLYGSSTPSVTYKVRYGSNITSGTLIKTAGSTVTSVTTGDETTSFDNGTIAANTWVWIRVTAQSGTVTNMNVTITYTE